MCLFWLSIDWAEYDNRESQFGEETVHSDPTMEEPLTSLEQEYLLLEAKVETRLDVCPAEMLIQNYLITTGQFFELLKRR